MAQARGRLDESGAESRRPWPRPLLWLTVAFAVGTAAERFLLPGLHPGWTGAVSAALILLAALSLRRPNSPLHTPGLPLAIFFALGFFASQAFSPPPFDPIDKPQVLYAGRIGSSPDFYPENKVRLPFELEGAFVEGQWRPMRGTVQLTMGNCPPSPGLFLSGEHLLVRLTLKSFHNYNNPGGNDYVRSQAEKGIFAKAYLPEANASVRLAPDLPAAMGRIERFRQNALFWLNRELAPDRAAFFAALLLGYQRFIPVEWNEHLSRSGVTHLLSISGLHLGLIAIVAFRAVRASVRKLFPSLLHRMSDQHLALIPTLAATLGYALISGFGSAPIWRSLLMLAVYLAATYRFGRPDGLTTLAAAALAILAMDPNQLYQISFQLSFGGVLAIFILFPRFEGLTLERVHSFFSRDRWMGKALRPFEDAFWLSVAVSILLTPLTAYHFYGVSVAGFAANIVLVPLVGFVVLPAGLLALSVFAVNEYAATLLLKVAGFLLGLSMEVIRWFSELSWAYFWVGTVSIAALACYYGWISVILGGWSKAWKGGATVALGMAWLLASPVHDASLADPQSLQADVIDVGQGTSVLLRFPGGKTMLVDGGGFYDSSYDIGRMVLAPCLWRLGVSRIDVVVLSHDHPDHRNGLGFILANFDVGELWESGLKDKSPQSMDLADIGHRRNIPVRTLGDLSEGATIGECRVRILHPTASYIESSWNGDLNNISIVLGIDYGKTRIILPGDIDQSVEELIFSGGTPSSEQVVVVAPHHGSERSNGKTMLDTLRPKAVIFPCGFDNPFNLPAPSAVERYKTRNVAIYRTDFQGLIHAASNGERWEIRPTVSP
ncbi:MAG: DNA internalization-related competence protein ComEC/Rec2 [Acidobacteriota bacterium]